MRMVRYCITPFVQLYSRRLIVDSALPGTEGQQVPARFRRHILAAGDPEAHVTAVLTRRADNIWCNNGFIAGCYQGLGRGPSPGAVVGIVLGSIAGFLFLMWLLWIMSNGTVFIRTSRFEEEDVVVSRTHRSRSPRSRRSHRSSYNAEMRHSSPRRERVIRQERIVRDVPPPREDRSRVRENIIVEESRPERRVDGDDIVEVIEEHSSIGEPPPRRKSRRQSSAYR